ncbi:Cilia- and flagella-associated protein 91, partial [Cladochytrium tenue]
ESEAQTDPFTPEHLIRPGSAIPELLALATLTYGAGLPAGVAELEMIERARAKRAWEASLPQVVDEASFALRLKMMEDMELKEWQEREEEIRRLQEARLQVLAKVIEKRELENEAINNERVARIWQRKLQERDAMMEKIEKRRQKALRKLAEMRGKVEPTFARRDVIAEYADYGSSVYAPRARDGLTRDRSGNTLRIEIEDLETYQGMTALVVSASTKCRMLQKEHYIQEQLRLMDAKIKERRQATELSDLAEEPPLRFAKKIEKAVQRPPTPRIRAP